MVEQIKKYIIFAVIGAVFYFLLSYHFVIFGRTVKLLEKEELSMTETFVNVAIDELTTPLVILRQHPETRRDGLGELMVEMEVITETELYNLEARLDQEE